uniref:SGNH hydrolase-type esterase domain-containing protein n=1 Tax=Pygocentrus nattereri TaxID=42514 RepID=A0AAR2INH5_PYGNA
MASSQDRALQALSSELARLDRQITALLKRQDGLLQQKSQLEVSREVSPSVVAPASTLRTPGDAVLMPAPAPPGPWERQRRRRSPPTPSPTPWAPSPAPAPRYSAQDSVYVIGSSIVRHVRVRGVNSHATVSCFPGARVLDIAKRLPSALRRRDAFGTVTMSDAIIYSGPIPMRRGTEAYSRLSALNCWMSKWCSENQEGFPGLIGRDGVHPTREGAALLSCSIAHSLLVSRQSSVNC